MIKFSKRAFAFAAAAMIVLSSSVALAQRTTVPVSDQGTVTIEQPQSSQTAPPTAAQTPEPEENATETAPAVSVPTPVPVAQEQNVVETGQNQKEMERKYASKGFVILWVFLVIIINAVVSFAIANRFYKLARKENHVASEVRALRRDLEEKFAQSVDVAAEMETDVTNTNENYSPEGSVEEIATSSFSKESEDIFKQWETKMARRAAAKPVQTETEEAEAEAESEEDSEEPKRIKKYMPLREKSADADGENALKAKAKDFIGTIFPFKD